MLASLTSWATEWIATFGPVALAGMMLVETVFPPIPSEVVLPFAGFLIGRGELDPVVALLASTGGSVAGALALYAASRSGGRALVLRFGRFVKLTPDDLERSERWFDEHGTVAVFVARMVPGARSLISVPAGTANMPILRFTLLTTAGSLIWNAALLGAGYLLGDNWQRIDTFIGPVSLGVGAVIALGVVVFVIRRRRAA
ncbi:MAG TPA: DedA family protein [Actinomycetota bacterium]|nr:DedA family protein [Actinomycetota bacterium]